MVLFRALIHLPSILELLCPLTSLLWPSSLPRPSHKSTKACWLFPTSPFRTRWHAAFSVSSSSELSPTAQLWVALTPPHSVGVTALTFPLSNSLALEPISARLSPAAARLMPLLSLMPKICRITNSVCLASTLFDSVQNSQFQVSIPVFLAVGRIPGCRGWYRKIENFKTCTNWKEWVSCIYFETSKLWYRSISM